MAYYLMLTKLTDQGRKTVREHPERILEVNKEVESLAPGDIKIAAQWFLLGPYDFATVIQAPDNWNMSYIAMELGSRGTVETLTMPALGVDEFISFMKAEDKVAHMRRRPSSRG